MKCKFLIYDVKYEKTLLEFEKYGTIYVLRYVAMFIFNLVDVVTFT